nr:LRR receptor-like serine/threonine-protein kinase ERL1 [Malus domestica]
MVISSSIGNLTALVNLDTSDNQLDGKIPNSLGNLCKLMVLEFSRNNFSGSISEIFESLSTCSSGRIELLGLSDNNLSGYLSQLGNFKNLGSLDFSSNSISGPIPVSLGNLSCLESLDIGNNQLEGVVSEVHFTNLTKLKYFYASENSLTLKTSLDWLPPFQLNTLFLNSWHLEPSELPAWLQTQTKLYALNLSNTAISGNLLVGKIPSKIGDMRWLESLDLSRNKLTGQISPSMSKLTFLSNLNLSNYLTGHQSTQLSEP